MMIVGISVMSAGYLISQYSDIVKSDMLYDVSRFIGWLAIGGGFILMIVGALES